MSFNNFSSSVKLDNIKTYNKLNTTNNSFKNTFYSDIEEIDYSEYKDTDYNSLDLEKEIEDSKNDKKWYEEVIEWDKKVKATGCVVTTTVVSGGLKIAEYAADGLTWLGGMATSGIVRLFGKDELAEDIEEATMDEIARDKVGELNEVFYEETELGRSINEASVMKYDSEAAKKIQNITTDVVVIAGATAATVVTGGAAAPLFVAGFAIGAGESAEKNFQDKENRDFWKDSVEIGVDGTIKGLSTVAYGKAGATAINGAKSLSNLGLTGTKELIKTNVKGISKEAIKETVKNNGKTILKSTAVNTLKDKDTWVETGTVLLDDVKTGIQTGEWDAMAMLTDAALIYGENYIGNLGGNLTDEIVNLSKRDYDKLYMSDLEYESHNAIENASSKIKSNIRKYVYTDTNQFNGLNERIMENGLYHFTDSADAIMDSGFIKATGEKLVGPLGYLGNSYGNAKTFFFEGIPDAGAFASNLDCLPLKATAIHVKPSQELVSSSSLKIRNLDDQAITYDGRFDLSKTPASKEYFCLKQDGNKLVYERVSEEIYNNYDNTNEAKRISEFLNNKKNVNKIKNDYYFNLNIKNTGALSYQ